MEYNKLKDTDAIWIPKIPEHWELIKVRHLFKESTIKGFPNEPLLVASQEHGVVNKDVFGKRTMEATKDFHLLKLVQEGDFVISLRSFQGGIELAHQRGIISPAYTILKEKKAINKRYFKHLFKSKPFISLMTLCVKGIRDGQNIDFPTFKNEYLPFPPINEQERIGAYLDRKTQQIQEFIAKKERLIELLEEKKQSILRNVTTKGVGNESLVNSGVNWIGKMPKGWETKRIKYLGKFISGYSFDSGDFIDEGVKVIKISNIQPMKILWDEISWLPENFYEKHKNFRVFENDLVFALTRPIIKGGIKVAIIEGDEKLLINQRNAIYRPNNHLLKSWLYYVILNRAFINEFDLKIDHTGQQPNISTNDIGNIYIPFPSISVQKKIVNHLQGKWFELNNIINKANSEIEKAKEYQESLITQVVTGQLKVPFDPDVPKSENQYAKTL